MAKTLKQRIALDGGKEIQSELASLGKVGEAAFRKLQAAANDLKGPTPQFVQSLKQASVQLKSLGDQFTSIGRQMQSTGRSLSTYVTAPIVALGGLSLKAFGDFQQGLSNVGTLVDTTKESIADMGKEVQAIGKRTPVSLNDLLSALYQIRSAGIKAADAMQVLEGSAKLGVVGLGTTAEAADVATSAINAFHLSGQDLADVFDTIFAAVKNGKTTISGLAQGFGGVAAVIAHANVPFKEFLAAIATLTQSGLPAAQAYTYLQSTIVGLNKAAAKGDAVFKKLGVESFDELVKHAGGLVNALRMVDDALNHQDIEWKKLLPRVQGYNAVLGLTGKNAATVASVMADFAGSAGRVNEKLAEQIDNVNNQFVLLKNSFEGLKIAIGQELVPQFNALVKSFTGLVEGFNNLDDSTKKNIIKWAEIVAAIGPVILVLGILAGSIGAVISLIGTIAAAIAAAPVVGAFLAIGGAVALAAGAFEAFAGSADPATKAALEHKKAVDAVVQAYKDYKAGRITPEQFNTVVQGHLAAARAALQEAQANLEVTKTVVDQQKVLIANSRSGLNPMSDAAVKEAQSGIEASVRAAEKLVQERQKAIDDIMKAASGDITSLGDTASSTTKKIGDVAGETGKSIEHVVTFIRGGQIVTKTFGDTAVKSFSDAAGKLEEFGKAGRATLANVAGGTDDATNKAARLDEAWGKLADAKVFNGTDHTTKYFKDLGSNVVGLGEKVDATADKFNRFTGTVKLNGADAATYDPVTKKIEYLGSKIVDVTADVNKFLDAQKSAAAGATGLATNLGKINATDPITPVKDKMGEASTAASDLSAKVGEVGTSLAKLPETVGPVGDAIASLKDNVGPNLSAIVDQVGGIARTVDAVVQSVNDAAAQLSDAAKQVSDAWSKVPESMVGVGDAARNAATQAVQAFGTVGEDIAKQFSSIGDVVAQAIQGALQVIAQNLSDLEQQVTTLVNNLKAQLMALQAAINAAKSAAASSGGSGAYAGGGRVFGKGTGTSDSIPAWLSNGEFVVRASAVKKYGLSLLHALNSMRLPKVGFSIGGLVDTGALSIGAPSMNFAMGGAVGPSGRPINLSIGGQTFPMSASEDVAQRLSRIASGQRLRSIGSKPSWYGGR